MRNNNLIIYIFLAFIFSIDLNAQDPVTFDPQSIYPQTPNARAMAKFIETPVTLNTGVPSISIPITSVPSRHAGFPISLSYHAGGHKVEDVASNVGLGWSLNAGGMISRNVQGKPDELFFLNTSLDPWDFDNLNQQDAHTWVHEIQSGNYDFQPDIFNFNFAGYSGKFFFDRFGTVLLRSDDNLIIHEYRNGGWITSFEVTTPDGSIYVFGSTNRNIARTSDIVLNQINIPDGLLADQPSSNYPNNWHLVKIKDVNRTDVIDFIYEKYTIDNLQRSEYHKKEYYNTEDYIQQTPEPPCDFEAVNSEYEIWNYSNIRTHRIKEIRTNTHKAKFIYEAAPRKDLVSDNALDKIEIYTNANVLIKGFDLIHKYFESPMGVEDIGIVPNITDDERINRLSLEKIIELGTSSGTLPYYNFYYNEQILPDRFSYSQDFWGYYNGILNEEFIPTMRVFNLATPSPEFLCIPGANRHIDETFSKALILTSFENLSGSSTSFDYESHEAENTLEHYYIPPMQAYDFEMTNSQDNLQSDGSYESNFTIGDGIETPVAISADSDCTIQDDFGCFLVKIINNATNQVVVQLNDGHSGSYNIAPGSYTIRLEIWPGAPVEFNASINLEWMEVQDPNYTPPPEIKVGGLRVKSMTANDLTKNYTYTTFDESQVSSGKILGTPTFYEFNDYKCHDINIQTFPKSELKLSSSSVLPLTSAAGEIIAYTNVKEELSDSDGSLGWNEYVLSYSPDIIYGATQIDNSLRRGLVEEQRSYDELGSIVQETINDYISVSLPNHYSSVLIIDLPTAFGQHITNYLGGYHNVFNRSSDKYLLDKTTVKTFGENTGHLILESFYTYDDKYNMISKTDQVEGNSSKSVTTDIQYSNSIALMRNKGITGLPVKSIITGLIKKGSRTRYRRVNGDILPFEFYQIGSNGNERKIGEILSYNSHAKPLQYKKLNYLSESFTWHGSGNIQERKWTDSRVWSYNYDNVNNLISSTDLKGVVNNYTYDEFQRLETSTLKNGTQAYSFDYKYNLIDGINSVETNGSFQNVNYNVNQVQFFDTYGRPTMQLERGYLASGQGYNALGAENSKFHANEGAGQYIEYEKSPLIREKKVTWAGWAGEVQITNGYNTEEINGWPANTLHMKTVLDENSQKSESFTDFLGRVVCKKVYLDNNQVATTLYKYDIGGNVSEIEQPNGQKFTYTYDEYNRLLSKSIPGAGIYEYLGYNDKDQFTQEVDPNLNVFTYEYTDFGEVEKIETGNKLLSSFGYGSSGGSNGQLVSETHAILPLGDELGTSTTSYQIDDLGRITGNVFSSPITGTHSVSNILDHGDRVEQTVISQPQTSVLYEYTHDHVGRNHITHQTLGGVQEKINHSNFGTSNDWLTQVKQGGINVPLHTIDYAYNNRGWMTTIGACNSSNNNNEPPLNDEKTDEESGEVQFRYNIDELCNQFGSVIEIIWIRNIGKPVTQTTTTTQTINLNGGKTINPISQTKTLLYEGPPNAQTIAREIINEIGRDGRPIPNGPWTGNFDCEELLAGAYGDFIYSILVEQLGDIFDDYLVTNNPNTIFGIGLQYEDPIGNATPQFNGNISSMEWCTALGESYSYEFEYDALNRLIESKSNYNNRYGTSYEYDLAGNINSIKRMGVIEATPLAYTYATPLTPLDEITDNLSFSYSGHRLSLVRENANQTFGFKGSSKIYEYDDNGNMVESGNLIIKYTVTNMPYEITNPDSENGGTIFITYDAAGNKLRKITPEYEKLYLGPVEYKDGALEAVYHDQGRTIPADGGFRTEYNIKDHLGSVRLTYSDINGDGTIEYEDELLQENHFYPFGMAWDGNRLMPEAPNVVNPYQYNGKEMNSEIGLDWLDYGARWYDPSIGRWNAVDPLAEQYQSWSTYNYTLNNPIRYIDPDGRGVNDLIVRGSSTAMNKFENHLNAGLGDYATAQVDQKTGKVSISINEGAEGTKEQKANAQNLQKVIDDKGETEIGLVESSRSVFGGRYNREKIDVDDMENIGNEGPFLTSNSATMHEVMEQYDKQITQGLKGSKSDVGYDQAHGVGIGAEHGAMGVINSNKPASGFTNGNFTNTNLNGLLGVEYSKNGRKGVIIYNVSNNNILNVIQSYVK